MITLITSIYMIITMSGVLQPNFFNNTIKKIKKKKKAYNFLQKNGITKQIAQFTYSIKYVYIYYIILNIFYTQLQIALFYNCF